MNRTERSAGAALGLLLGMMTACAPRAAVGPGVDALLRDTRFNGVVLVGEGDRVLQVRGEGQADFERGLPSRPDTKYQTGSLSKWVATVVVLQLVDAGLLSLTAPLGELLPGYRRDTGAKLTLHHLLSHTSGVPNDVIAALRAAPDLTPFATLGTDEAVARYASGDLLFEPGARFDYSHSNWLLVKAVIEHATQQPYRQVVHERLLGPLHLEDSGILEGDVQRIAGMAQAYASLDPVPRRVPVQRVSPMPDMVACMGGYYSTAPDLLRLMDAVLGGPVLTPASRERLGTVVVAEEGYAYGGRVRTMTLGGQPRRVHWNNCSNGAYKTLAVHTDDGKSVVLLNNTSASQEQLGQLGESLLDLLYSSTSAPRQSLPGR